jgi:hypothetical protein
MSVRPEDFASDTPPERIIASENETTILFEDDVYGAHRLLSLGNLAIHHLIDPNILAGNGTRYLLNGGKAYLDVGGSIEYCAPESLGPTEATLTDFAGIPIMNRLLTSANVEHRGMFRRVGTSKLNKLLIEGQYSMVIESKTAGYHENYLITTDLNDKLAAPDTPERLLLESYLATKIIWAGAGAIGSQGTYQLSQKAMGISKTPGSTTHTGEAKPMFLLKGTDTDTQSDGYSRLEIRLADPTLSPWSRRLSFAMTSLVLRLCEHASSKEFQQLTAQCLKDPYPSVMPINTDLTFALPLETIEGKKTTARELQRNLGAAILALGQRVRFPNDEQQAVQDHYELMDELEASTFTSLYDRIDSSARYRFLSHNFPGAVTIHNSRALAHDIHWDKVDKDERGQTGRGLRHHRAYGRPIVNDFDAKIDHYVSKPPAGTRAASRVKLLEEESRDITSVVWAGVKTKKYAYRLFDPYGHHETVRELAA